MGRLLKITHLPSDLLDLLSFEWLYLELYHCSLLQATVYKAFLVSALMFIVMGAIGRVVKKDLSGMGRALMGVLIGVIIASVVNMFLRSSGMDYILSIISVFLFAGLTAWDNQKIRYVYDQTNGQPATGWAVAMALELYLDFINLFISLLRIFGRND